MRVPALIVAALMAPGVVRADDLDASAKAVEIEVMRLRLGFESDSRPRATLIEAEEALARYRRAGPADKEAARVQLDLALARLDMELMAAAHRTPDPSPSRGGE